MHFNRSFFGPVLAALMALGSTGFVVHKAQAAEQTAGQSATVVVKFAEGSGLRVRAGTLVATGSSLSTSAARDIGSALASAGADLGKARRLHSRAEADIDRERTALQASSGEDVPDLNLYYVIPVPAGMTAEAFSARLSKLRGVESAEPAPRPAPPPVDLAPTTPSFTSFQTYRGAAPAGVAPLSGVVGGRGTGIRVVDIEYSWQFNHEDLELTSAINLDTGATLSDPFGDTNHGTAVLGEIYGRPNAYGVTGLAPLSTMRVAPANTLQFGYNPARAISIATSKLRAGDVILIEQQYWVCGTNNYGPLEWLQSVYDAIRVATAKGIIVVQAAGNGNVNLDGANCQGKFNRAVRDSRAIIVGAGSSGGRTRLGFSSYGSRVDVQGWGQNVMTTGYGDAFNPSIRQRYTKVFSGTSSASPIVTGVVAQLQGALKAKGLKLATPREMRRALVATGSAQVTPPSGKIGPLPNAKKALTHLLNLRAAQKRAGSS